MRQMILGLILCVLTAGGLSAQEEGSTVSLEGTKEVLDLLLEDIFTNYSDKIEEGTLVVAAPGNRCNGGTCLPKGGTTPLSCPTSGGPLCNDSQTCQCTCFRQTDTSPWQTKNECVAKASS